MRIIAIRKQGQEEIDMQSNFGIWLHQEIMRATKNFKVHFPLSSEEVGILADWAEETKPDLKKFNIVTAYSQAYLWNQQKLSQQYKTNDIIYSWKDGWKIVKLPQSTYSSKTPQEEHIDDIEIERELMLSDSKRHFGQLNLLEDENKSSEYVDQNLYSLRDPQNIPNATIEIRNEKEQPELLYVHEIIIKENEENKDKEIQINNYIKDFFNYLKSQGYAFLPVEGGSEDIKAPQLSEIETNDKFGLPYEIWGIGGSEDNYLDSLQEAYYEGSDGYMGRAENVVDDLVQYAKERNELDKLEKALNGYSVKGKNKDGKDVTKYMGFSSLAENWWMEYENSMIWQNPLPEEPNEEDFIMQPDIKESQPEFPNMPAPQQKIDKNAYEQAMKEYEEKLKLHEEEISEIESGFEPYRFQSYVYQEIERAKRSQPVKRKTQETKENIKAENMKTKIFKISEKADKTDKMPDGEQMALYVLTLKQYLKDNGKNTPEEWQNLISQLPSPRQIRQDFSMQELKLLYETVEYLWERVTGQKIIQEKEIIKAPETLMGNYWLLNNGILLNGINHYGIIKNNSSLICSLLDIGGMAIQEYLGSHPNKLLYFIIKHGGVRLFITKDRKLYCQMSPTTYAEWGREKIRKLDFKFKAVKLIDLRVPYSGWKSGLTIKL